MGKPSKQDQPSIDVPFTDLRSITRQSDKCLTVVKFDDAYGERHGERQPWLEFGQAQIRTMRDQHDGRWSLEARLPEGVTDFEHDSGYAIKLPLVGLEFTGVLYHQTQFRAWIDPNEYPRMPNFHVPRPGYNPMKHPDAYTCKDKHCGEAHIIVPEGMYVPPFDPELYAAVRGKRVSILIGVNLEEDAS